MIQKKINKLLSAADIKMKAMIWLGLNCAYLKWTDLDYVNARVKLARRKTGIYRDLSLWPESVKSLQNISRKGRIVFYTSRAKPYIQIKLTRCGNMSAHLHGLFVNMSGKRGCIKNFHL